ncbi:MAG: Clp protease N-terminal domain-containing protein [Candidatus Dormiibacterota bacterium]
MPDAAVELERASADIPLTRDARDILERASAAAKGRGESASPTDVLEATLHDRGTLAVDTIRALGIDPAAIAAQVQAPNDGTAPPAISLRQLLVNANREAQVLGHYQVDSIHLLLAMLYSDSPTTSAVLQKAGVTLYDVRRHLQTGRAISSMPAQTPRSRPPDAALRRRPLPSLRGAVSVSPVFVAILGATAFAGALLWFDVLPGLAGPLTIIFVTAGWITSLCVHEFGHALIAYLGGDRSVAASGYLTLNPLRYTNILLSLVMPILFLLLGGIGLPGGAVYINRPALRSRTWDTAVSLAGPAGTLLCGLLVAIPFLIPGMSVLSIAQHIAFFEAIAFLGFIEAIALVLNLVPIPGLDGFGALRPWLPSSLQDAAVRYGQLGIIGVFIVLWFVPSVSNAFFGFVLQLTDLERIPRLLIALGQAHMQLR